MRTRGLSVRQREVARKALGSDFWDWKVRKNRGEYTINGEDSVRHRSKIFVDSNFASLIKRVKKWIESRDRWDRVDRNHQRETAIRGGAGYLYW